MSREESFFIKTGQKIDEAEQSQMFGKPCFKIKKKAFVCYFRECMVFKLPEEIRIEALSLKGACLFDPSGKGRPMKEWAQVPFTSKNKWETFVIAAVEYVKKGA